MEDRILASRTAIYRLRHSIMVYVQHYAEVQVFAYLFNSWKQIQLVNFRFWIHVCWIQLLLKYLRLIIWYTSGTIMG